MDDRSIRDERERQAGIVLLCLRQSFRQIIQSVISLEHPPVQQIHEHAVGHADALDARTDHRRLAGGPDHISHRARTAALQHVVERTASTTVDDEVGTCSSDLDTEPEGFVLRPRDVHARRGNERDTHCQTQRNQHGPQLPLFGFHTPP